MLPPACISHLAAARIRYERPFPLDVIKELCGMPVGPLIFPPTNWFHRPS